MARNQYGGRCYRCAGYVQPGEGHFEISRNGWKVQHADCAIRHRGTDLDVLEADRVHAAAQHAFSNVPLAPARRDLTPRQMKQAATAAQPKCVSCKNCLPLGSNHGDKCETCSQPTQQERIDWLENRVNSLEAALFQKKKA